MTTTGYTSALPTIMNSISMFSTSSAVINIIEVLGKTIDRVRQIANDYRATNLRIFTFLSQLVALQDAFNKIQEWMDSNIDGAPYYQLVMDLDVAIACCRSLLGKLESMLKEGRELDGDLDMLKTNEPILSQKNLEDLQKRVETQTGALALLLTACTCKTLSAQKNILEDSGTRKAIRKIQADKESLFEHQDTGSSMTLVADRLSKLSSALPLEKRLFISQAFERALRSPQKSSLKMDRNRSPALQRTRLQETSHRRMRLQEMDHRKRSREIDRDILVDSIRLNKECKILLLGSVGNGRSDLLRAMKREQEDRYSEEKLQMDRQMIYKYLVDSVKTLVSAMRQFGIEPEKEENQERCSKLMEYNIPEDPNTTIDKTIGDMINLIWTDPCIGRVMELSAGHNLLENSPYFFDEVTRITSSDYIPTEEDILRAMRTPRSQGLTETWVEMGQLKLRIFEIHDQQSKVSKWIHFVENVSLIIFVVNLADYDKVLPEDSDMTQMTESMFYFKQVINSRFVTEVPVVLFLNNVEEFKEKLPSSPLSNYFPDYSGGNDINSAARYIYWRFNQIKGAKINFYAQIVQLNHPSSTRVVYATIKEALLNSALQFSGVL